MGHSNIDAQNDPDGIFRSLVAVESALAVIRERVSRLEEDVRNLQTQNANRS